MAKKKPVIAIAQIRYFSRKHNDNVAKIIEYIGLAKKAKADIVCFPESCLKKRGCVFLLHSSIESIRKACRANSIWCIINDDILVKGKKYNMSLLIDRKGKIRGRYKKIHLYGDNVHAGRKVKVFRTDFAKVGMAICWDITYPGLFSEMRKKGAEIVFCPSEWNYDEASHKSRHRHWEKQLLRSMVLARAHENVFYIALCNPLLDSKTQVSYSAIASPNRILKEIVDKEGLIAAEVKLSEIKKFRKFYDK